MRPHRPTMERIVPVKNPTNAMRITCGSMNALPTSIQLNRSRSASRAMTPSSRNFLLTYLLSCSVKNFASHGDRGVRKNEERPKRNVNSPSWRKWQSQFYLRQEGVESLTHENKNPRPARLSLDSVHVDYGCRKQTGKCT